MGRKRYFCDYCDSSLPYSVDARKKHNSGHQHRAAKQQYFDNLKSATERYQDELKKNKCNRYHSGQICAFGDACIYSHVTQTGLDTMRSEAEMELKKKTVPRQLLLQVTEPSIEHIKSVLEARSHLSLKSIKQVTYDSVSMAHFENYHPLPPSLQPFKMEDLLTAQLSTWG